jgi:hypothetical protein
VIGRTPGNFLRNSELSLVLKAHRLGVFGAAADWTAAMPCANASRFIESGVSKGGHLLVNP